MSRLTKELYVFELIAFSGGVIFSGTYPRTCLIIWIVTALFLLRGRLREINNIDRRHGFFLVSWILLVQFVFVRDDFDNKYLSYILYLLGSYGLVRFSYEEFRTILLRWMTWLAFISMVVQVGYDFLGFPSTIHKTPDFDYTISCGMFNVAWASGDSLIHRLSSIFWEPGQYQILIIYTLCLYVNELSDYSNPALWFRKFGVLLMAMVMTQSTMGYIVLALLLMVSFFFSKKRVYAVHTLKSMIVSGVIVLLVCSSIFLLWKSPVVQEKLEQRNETVYDNSYTIRLADNTACLMAAIESPIYGQGISTTQLKRRLISLGSQTSSNGWLLSAASLGFTYVIMLLFFMYKRIKEMDIKTPTLMVLGVLFVSQCNESVLFFPYMYIYMFHFRDSLTKNL